MGLEMASSSAGSSEGERGAFLGGCDCATMRHVCSVLFGDVDPSPWLPDEKSALGSGFDRLAGQGVHPQNLRKNDEPGGHSGFRGFLRGLPM